jgi:peptidoglycan/LPS O-acetylase OafA/YrhL
MFVSQNSTKKIYFPNLNGLRCIAAFLVIIHHIEQLKSLLNINNFWEELPFVQQLGILGVNLFFVLSGFLITYLLLAEELEFKTIHIGKFYMRRILRIWPLYFLIVFLAFFVLPHISLFILPGYGKDVIYSNLFLRLFLYAIFLPNVVQPLLGIVPYVSQTWSIGTEEQYYLIWPIILKYIKNHRIALMLLIIILYFVIGYFLYTPY